MGRSRKLTLTDWTSANNALMLRFGGNKSELAKCAKKSRTTVNDFFKGKPIGENSFYKICSVLRLNWKEVSSSTVPNETVVNDPVNSQEESKYLLKIEVFIVWQEILKLQIELQIEILIEQIRNRCRQKILDQHSRIRLLSGEEIGVDQLYVDVWLLEKPERKHFNTPESLLSNFDITKDRLALSRRIQRNPGFEVANHNSKLVILGKPGSGKTTFLRHLAIDWCKGKFQPDLITILLELRQIQDNQWDIWSAIGQELSIDDWHQFAAVKKGISELRKKQSAGDDNRNTIVRQLQDLKKQLKSCALHHFLDQGRFLILIDGLDESATEELRYIIQDQLREVSQDYPKNRFIVTCRTQIMEVIPSGFGLLEVADFSPEQVRQFVQNWFTANGQTKAESNELWETVNYATTNQPDLRELTANPVLLSLICLVLQDERGKVPTDRGWLYKKGVKLLLSRWNDEKEIESWEVGTVAYRQLSTENKEALLIEIAARKFESPKNYVLFEQDELVNQLSQKLQLANAREGLAVLKAIETQHGLLIERADELWSFSHLTFQEYFTVQWLTQLAPQELAEKIANQQWQGVVRQLVKSQQPADLLLRLIKQAIDQSMTQDPVFQTFLDWLLQKSDSLQINYKSVAIRAFYYSLTHALELDLARALELELVLDFKLDLAFDRDLYLAHDLVLDLDRAHIRACDLDLARSYDLELDYARAFDVELAIAHAFTRTFNPARTRALDHARAFALDRALDHAQTLNLSPDLIACLRLLKNKLPTSNHSKEIQRWWSLNGAQWIEQLRQVMIEYQNIGHDWQFTEEQQQQLQRYYAANKFLVDLMKIQGAVSEVCRIEIEDGLLLPWAELQRRQHHPYGELEA